MFSQKGPKLGMPRDQELVGGETCQGSCLLKNWWLARAIFLAKIPASANRKIPSGTQRWEAGNEAFKDDFFVLLQFGR